MRPIVQLDREQAHRLVDLAGELGLDEPERRSLLLAHLPVEVVGSLATHARPRDQILSDLMALSRMDGLEPNPLTTWLDNAWLLAGPRREAAELRTLRLQRSYAPWPTFRVGQPRPMVKGLGARPKTGLVQLEPDNWDDFGFKTSFRATYVGAGEAVDLGTIKILHRAAPVTHDHLPLTFFGLDSEFVSLGDRTYYQALRALPNGGRGILIALNDLAFLPDLPGGFLDHGGVQASLLRGWRITLEEIRAELFDHTSFPPIWRLDHAEPAEPGDGPVEPEAEAVEPPGGAVEPLAEAVEPPAEAVEREAEALEPQAEAVNPQAEAVEREAEAVEPPAEAEPQAEAAEPNPVPPDGTLWLRMYDQQCSLSQNGHTVWPRKDHPTPTPTWKELTFSSGTLAEALHMLPRLWDRSEVERFGTELAHHLFGHPIPPEVKQAFAVAPGQSRRLVLDLAPDAAALPWEYLYVDGAFLLERRLSIVRHVPHHHPKGLTLSPPPKAVMFAFANPPPPQATPQAPRKHFDDAGWFNSDQHQALILPAIQAVVGGLQVLPQCTPDALYRALVEKRSPQPKVFHFLGHGRSNPPGLVVMDNSGQKTDVMSAADLVAYLGRSSTALAFLGSCYGGEAASRDGLAGVGRSIAEGAGILVVAMQMAVPQDFSSTFAAAFYRALGEQGFDVERAVAAARLVPTPEGRHVFGIPVLYGDFKKQPAPQDLPEAPVWAFPVRIHLVSGDEAVEQWSKALLPPSARNEVLDVVQQAAKGKTPIPAPPARADDLQRILEELAQISSDEARDKATAVLQALRRRPRAPVEVEEEVRTEGDHKLAFSWASPPSLDGLLDRYAFPPALVHRVLSELAAGRHVLFTGPVGTGKTTLAREVTRLLGYDLHEATASADWTTAEVVGGHWPVPIEGEDKVKLVFRPGAFLEAVTRNWWETDDGTWRRVNRGSLGCWLLLDEINRADMDRAMGGLFTALESGCLRVPTEYREGGPATRTVPIPEDFRVLATLNDADRHYLFRLSDALKRRFAFIEVSHGIDLATEWLRVEDKVGGMIPLDNDVRRFVYLVRLFQPVGIAHLLRAVQFCHASEGSPLSLEARLEQAIAGSILPGLGEIRVEAEKCLSAWMEGGALTTALGDLDRERLIEAARALTTAEPPAESDALDAWLEAALRHTVGISAGLRRHIERAIERHALA